MDSERAVEPEVEEETGEAMAMRAVESRAWVARAEALRAKLAAPLGPVKAKEKGEGQEDREDEEREKEEYAVEECAMEQECVEANVTGMVTVCEVESLEMVLEVLVLKQCQEQEEQR